MIESLKLEDDYEPDHVKRSVGGIHGHLLRRAIHLSLIGIPILYYWFGHDFGELLGLTRFQALAAILATIIIAEFVRLWFGITIIGQRDYEAKQLSALFWGAVGVCSVLLFAPELGVAGAAIGTPLIASLAFGDPAMGESRRRDFSSEQVIGIGVVTCTLSWVVCHFMLGTPLLLCIVMGPLCAFSELPRLRWIDDNGTMVLFPLILVLLLGQLSVI